MAESKPPGVDVSRPLIELDTVVAGYRGTEVLHGVSMRISPRSVVALLGPNGAGKTTTLRVIAGLIKPTTGRILLDGSDITRLECHRRVQRGMCDIPEGRGIFPSLTVRENLLLHCRPGAEAEGIGAAVELFPVLGQRLSQMGGSLSGGEQQMLAVSRAYINKPRFLAVDELSLGLAPQVIDKIYETVLAIANQGTAVLLVEQYISRALAMADDVYVLNRGRIAYSGKSEAVEHDEIFQRYLGKDIAAELVETERYQSEPTLGPGA